MSDRHFRILLVAPSRGLGGGIERYTDGLLGALWGPDTTITRVDYIDPAIRASPVRRFHFAAEVHSAMQRLQPGFRTLVVHPDLLPLAYPLSVLSRARECVVFFHGIDIPAAGRMVRYLTARGPGVRAVTVSSSSALALQPLTDAAVLPPGLSDKWFRALVQADLGANRSKTIDVLSVFRLSDWRAKGADLLLEACRSSQGSSFRAVLAGKGPPPAELLELVSRIPGASVVASPDDQELAALYGSSRVVVLATRVESGLRPSWEGFGMVLQEAQVAGLPVIGPASGPTDAYQPGTTGYQLPDESAEALRDLLHKLLDDERHRRAMALEAAHWARETYSPVHYRDMVRRVVLQC